MTWPLAMTTYEANLNLAAADVSPVIPVVRKGQPDNLNADTIAFWNVGWQHSRTGGEALTVLNIERGVYTIAYLRGSVRVGAIDERLEDRLIAVEAAIITRLMADRGLAGNSIGLFIDEAEYDWEEVGGQLARTVAFTAWIDLPEVFPLAL